MSPTKSQFKIEFHLHSELNNVSIKALPKQIINIVQSTFTIVCPMIYIALVHLQVVPLKKVSFFLDVHSISYLDSIYIDFVHMPQIGYKSCSLRLDPAKTI